MRHLLLLLALSILLLLGWLLAVTLVPRWWAQFLGDRIDGRITVGTGYGLTVGFLFTLVPLFVARQAFRDVAWKIRAAFLVVAALVAVPNLMTLGIVLGSGTGAHAGDRILDVDGPGFRVASTLGALGAAAVFSLTVGWGVLRHRDRKRVEQLTARSD
jgi:hypothetical protein